MALRSVISSKIPMVIVLGATGTGKTKLGVELAQKLGTEIISADSMQIYKGLDVVTAKATAAERELAHHHLLDILEPHQMFTVVDFRNRALKIIDNLIEQGKAPIIVGGTNYYIESIVYKILVEDMDDDQALLWDKSRRKRDLNDHDKREDAKRVALESSIDEPNDQRAESERKDSESNPSSSNAESKSASEEEVENVKGKLMEFVDNEKKFTNEEVHAKLKDIDPVMAERLHPNNRRKVLRSIEVWLKSGRRHSEILAEQKQTEGQLRRPGSTIIFWLKCEQGKGKPLTKEETKFLVALIESSRVITTKTTNATNNKLKNEEWIRLAERFNATATNCPRTSQQLRLKWENLKKNARKRSTKIRMNLIKAVHDARLDARVDKMLEEGLIEELLDFHARHNQHRMLDGTPPDYTKGVFQTLGFKEFHDYLMMSEEQRDTEDGRKLLRESIENMKRGTRRYARRQNKMVRGRFLEHPGREVPPIYELDTTDVAKWDENVKNKAVEIIGCYTNGTACNYEPLQSKLTEEKRGSDGNSHNYCEVCERIILGDHVYAIHLKSIRHMKVLKKKKRLQEQQSKQE